jgi:hypothetical protein
MNGHNTKIAKNAYVQNSMIAKNTYTSIIPNGQTASYLVKTIPKR